MIYSLDIFDTLLLRDESPEETLARLPDTYRDKRLALHHAHYPTPLLEFYKSINQTIEAELKLECEHLSINQEIIDFILLHPNDTFILVSDMYLNSDHVKEIFNKLGVIDFYEKLYISSEHNSSKEAFGKLFSIVINDYGSDIIHIGDNLKSDFIHATTKMSPAIHYVKESYEYEPDFSSGEKYYKNYVENILCPLMFLSIEKIKALVEKQKITQIVCLGSVFGFYKILLQDHFPDIEIKKLEISRFNIRYISFLHTPPKQFVRLRHSESFLRYYYPDFFKTLSEEVWTVMSIFERWAALEEIVEEVFDDLSAKSRAVSTDFFKQLKSKSIDLNDILFVDFGYQGTFCDLLNSVPEMKKGRTHTFLTVKEENPKHSCESVIQITPFRMPVKDVRDPFWILDSEIIIKLGSQTPLAYKEAHKNSSGWEEMYDHLLSCISNYTPPTDHYSLERELKYKVFRHICTIGPKTTNMFNWLSNKVQYNKYSISNSEDGIIKRVNGAVRVDTDKIIEFENSTYGYSEFANGEKPFYHFNYDKKSKFYIFFKYLESISKAKKLSKGEL